MATNSPVIKANADKLSAELGVQLGKIQVEAAGKVTTNAQKTSGVSSQTLPQFPNGGGGNLVQTLAVIPEGQKTEAIKEAQAAGKYDQLREEFEGIYKKAAGYGLGASVSPSDRKQIASYDAALTGKLMNMMPGVSTEELKNFQNNLLPSAYDDFTPQASGTQCRTY